MKMVIDTTVLLAIGRGEPEAIGFRPVLSAGESLLLWPVVLRAKMDLSRRGGPSPDSFLWALTRQPNVEMLPFDERIYVQAALALDRFGKGRHGAALSFVQCVVYAAAIHAEAQILCAGGGYHLTDAPVHPASAVGG